MASDVRRARVEKAFECAKNRRTLAAEKMVRAGENTLKAVQRVHDAKRNFELARENERAEWRKREDYIKIADREFKELTLRYADPNCSENPSHEEYEAELAEFSANLDAMTQGYAKAEKQLHRAIDELARAEKAHDTAKTRYANAHQALTGANAKFKEQTERRNQLG